MFVYQCKGTCARQIELEINNEGIITHCKFIGGCTGNTTGVAKLVTGRKANEVKDLLRGTLCRPTTSCPDQLSYAIETCMAQNA